MTAPTFVQIASSGLVTGVSASATLGVAATAGNLLVAAHFGRGDSSIAAPTGFTAVAAVVGPCTTGNGYGRLFYKVAAGGETTINQGSSPGDHHDLIVAEYAGLSASPVLDQHNEGVTDFSTGPTNPSITPAAGVPAVIIAAEFNNPNYGPTPPAGYTNRKADDGGTTPRTHVTFNDRLVDPTSGSYSGSYSGAGGETCWVLLAASFVGGGGGGGGGSTARASAIVSMAKRWVPSAAGLWQPDRRLVTAQLEEAA